MPTTARKQMPALSAAALASTMVELYTIGQTGTKVPPTEFRIFRKGTNKSDKGEFVFDEKAAASVMAAYKDKGVELSIDYDHAALKAGAVKAVAAGWFTLAVRDGELWAVNVAWTPQALDHFSRSEYRYFSPLFTYDDRTGRIQHLINQALTNTPALHGIAPLVAASAHTEEETMDPELKKALDEIAALKQQLGARDRDLDRLRGQSATAALSSTLGLPVTVPTDELQVRVAALVSFHKSVLAIAGKDSEAAAIGALTAMAEQAKEVGVLRQKTEEAEAATLKAEFGAYLDGLAKAGSDGMFLPPAKRKKAEAMALSLGAGKLTKPGIEAAKEYIGEMLIRDSAAGSGGTQPPASQMALSEAEQEILRNTNSSREQLLKYKTAKMAGGNG
jgi:phage I-like protein